jgi:hypothetical protein
MHGEMAGQEAREMTPRGFLRINIWTATLALLASGRPAEATTLTTADFTFTLATVDSSGTQTTLSSDALLSYFSASRCACATNLVATLALTSTGMTDVGSSSIDAAVAVGSDCDNSSSSGCTTIGTTLTLSSSQTSTSETISTSSFFSGTSCSTGAVSTRVWAIVRQDGVRLSSEPSLVINLGGSGPTTPTEISAVSADKGLLVSWKADDDSTTLEGHQVLCMPGLASPPAAAYDTCAALTTTDTSNPFSTLDVQYVCSGLVAVGTDSVRVQGLENGQEYKIAVVAIGVDGMASAASAVVTATPAPTVGFDDLYSEDGGTGSGCSVGAKGGGGHGCGAMLLVVAALLVGRLRRRRVVGAAAYTGALILASEIVMPGMAAAQSLLPDDQSLTGEPMHAETPSPASWNFELRFGPYRPDVDSEFSSRGSDARPYEQVFSSSSRLFSQIELDRQVSHRFGTWGVGVAVGYTAASAAALSADLSTRTGDTTSLVILPIGLSAVYRADWLRHYEPIGIVPYAKAGFDCAPWRIADSAKSSDTWGKTFGWHVAAGLSIDLTSVDPDAQRTMDAETGVNQIAAFFEVMRLDLDNFGSNSVLHVGDTTWVGGLMVEF